MKHTDHQTKVLRKLLRLAALERDKKCVRCGWTSLLETSHIYPKGAFRGMQYEIKNVVMLCGEGSPLNCHHNFWHKYPEQAKDWFADKYPDRADTLLRISQKVNKLDDYKTIKADLEYWISYYKEKTDESTK